MKFPPLPTRAFSLLGPVRVKHRRMRKDLGTFEPHLREIRLKTDMDPATAWATYWHEVMHVILEDSGLEPNVETAGLEELLCDAFGTYMAAAVGSGFLVVDPKKEEER